MPLNNLDTECALYRQLLDTLGVIIFVKDDDNNIVYANKAAAGTVNVTPAEMLGTHASQWYEAEECAKFLANDLDVIHNNRPKLNIIESYTKPDGQKRWLRTSKYPLNRADGSPWLLALYAVDVTELMMAQKAAQPFRPGDPSGDD